MCWLRFRFQAYSDSLIPIPIPIPIPGFKSQLTLQMFCVLANQQDISHIGKGQGLPYCLTNNLSECQEFL